MFNIKEVPLPNYTRIEDIVNSISHALGIPFCIVAYVLFLKTQVGISSKRYVAATVIYVTSMLLVFVGSALYHGLKPSLAKKVARLIDHSNIYIMISGMSTALILLHTYKNNPKTGTTVIITIWALSAIGIVLTFMDLKKFNIPQIFMYVGLGWASIFALRSVFSASEAGKKLAMMFIIGGMSITLGTILYLVGKKRRFFHAVFHVFVLIGTIVIFVGNYQFIQLTLA